jgi:hypothetical protein
MKSPPFVIDLGGKDSRFAVRQLIAAVLTMAGQPLIDGEA